MELEARTETYPLAETFVISRDSSDESESVVAEISHAGQTGYGEGTPIERYYEDGASARIRRRPSSAFETGSWISTISSVFASHIVPTQRSLTPA